MGLVILHPLLAFLGFILSSALMHTNVVVVVESLLLSWNISANIVPYFCLMVTAIFATLICPAVTSYFQQGVERKQDSKAQNKNNCAVRAYVAQIHLMQTLVFLTAGIVAAESLKMPSALLSSLSVLHTISMMIYYLFSLIDVSFMSVSCKHIANGAIIAMFFTSIFPTSTVQYTLFGVKAKYAFEQIYAVFIQYWNIIVKMTKEKIGNN